MESTVTQGKTASEVFADLAPGTYLVRSRYGGDVQGSYWLGTVTLKTGVSGMVFIPSEGVINFIGMDQKYDPENGWTWKLAPSGDDDASGELLTAMLAVGKYAASAVSYQNSLTKAKSLEATYKSEVRDAIVGFYDNHLDDSKQDEVNDLLESLGLDGISSEYTVTGTVTYTFEVQVEATSEDDAREIVDQQFTSLVCDEIDTDYYDDYDISSVSC